jgi:hypothetical protein
VRYLEGANPELPLVSGGPFLIPHLSQAGGLMRLAIANGSADPARPVIGLPAGFPAHTERPRATVLAPLAAPADGSVDSVSADGRPLRAGSELGHRGWLVLEWKSAAGTE